MPDDPSRQPAVPAPDCDLTAIHIQIGTKLQLISDRTGRPLHHFATLIGFLAGEAVLVKTPTENGALVPFREGERLTARVFSGLNVYTFATIVERVQSTPLQCLYLAFPKTVTGTALRKAIRIRTNLAGKASRATAGEAPQDGDVSITNLSIAGASFDSQGKLGELGEQITLSFAFFVQPGDCEVQFKTRATIRNLKAPKPGPAGSPGAHAHGVEFLDLEPTEQIKLQNFLYESVVAGRQTIV